MLDACRNSLQGARGGKGFLPVGQPSGVLVVFAAEPGKTASDTGQGSGPYAAALAAELVKPGQRDLIMFHHVRVAVIDKTNADQVPWTEDGIQRRDRVLFGGSKEQLARCDGVKLQVGSERRCLKPGAGETEWFKDCATCPEMVVVPACKFTMGSPQNEPERWSGEAQVRVSIVAPIAVGRFAVTFDEWDYCLADGGCEGYRPDDRAWGRGKNRSSMSIGTTPRRTLRGCLAKQVTPIDCYQRVRGNT